MVSTWLIPGTPMVYTNLTFDRYTTFIEKQRIFFIALFLVAAVAAFMAIDKTKFVHHNNNFWAQTFTPGQSGPVEYVTSVTIPYEQLDARVITTLRNIETKIESKYAIQARSILDLTMWHYERDHGSEFILSESPEQMSPAQIVAFIERYKGRFDAFISDTTIDLFLFSGVPMDIEGLKAIGLEEQVTLDPRCIIKPEHNGLDLQSYLYFAVFLALFFVLFSLVFRNFISGFSAVLVIIMTVIFSIFVIQSFLPAFYLHSSMLLIMVSISMLDYLYFYYRWNTTQYDKTPHDAMAYSLNRNFLPALWTTVITVMSLFFLIFMDSETIQSIVLSILIPSIVAYILNIILLPSILSYFHVTNSRILFYETLSKIADLTNAMRGKTIYVVIGFTSLLMVFEVAYFTLHPEKIAWEGAGQNIIKYRYNVDTSRTLGEQLIEIADMEQQMKGYDNIVAIDSPAQKALNVLHNLDAASAHKTLNGGNIDQVLFIFDLYGIETGPMNAFITTDRISEEENLIYELKARFGERIAFLDIGSRIKEKKQNESIAMFFSAMTALATISFFIALVFKRNIMMLGTLFVNAAPIVLLISVLILFRINLTIEAFIAFAISLALSSDASIHFTYIYWRNRYAGVSKDSSLRRMFYFSGTPVFLSYLILVFSFLLFVFNDIESFFLIGMYTSFLILVSLLVSFFVLPKLILVLDNTK